MVPVSGLIRITAQFASAVRYPAPVPATGQTNCYDSSGSLISCEETGQDGEYRSGVPWPVPRFTDNGDGTVTDMLTGLIWLKDANCLGAMNWQAALDSVKALAAGTCNLNDGSEVGQWRLPNVKELLSLMDYGHRLPALPENHPFDNAFPGKEYWTSTTAETGDASVLAVLAYMVLTSEGWALPFNKNNFNFLVWPVRDKQ